MMRFAVFASLAALSAARPQAGYSYSTGAPSSGGYSSGSPGFSSGGYSSGSPGFSSGGGTISPGPSAGGPSSGYSYVPSVAPVAQKHVYVHAAPPEVDDRTPQPLQKIAPPKKHYKLVFIKAPTPPPPTVPVLPVVPQDSEKTLVYVLVKKPGDQPPILVPTPAPTKPTKPEVFFIKYKTQKAAGGGPGAAYGAPSPTASGLGAGFSSPASLYGSPRPSPSSGFGAPSTGGPY